MFACRRKLANGKVKYYIRYHENGKLKYLKSEQYSDFDSKEKCEDWIKRNLHRFTELAHVAEAKRRIEARYKYPSIVKLMKEFEKRQKLDAPNSWETSMYYMEKYVLDFYINKLNVPDVKQWHLYYEDFRNFLLEEATAFEGRKKIEFSTKNHCIRTLNKFITLLASKYLLNSGGKPIKCRAFDKHLLNTRGIDDLFKSDEYEHLLKVLGYSRDFFIVLYNTGMRFNELYSLSISDIHFDDEIPSFLEKRFKKYEDKEGRRIYGFISLKSQIAEKTRAKSREKDGGVKRKPLKSCKVISAKNRRIIPIFDQKTWEIIEENYHRGCDEYEKGLYLSDNPSDYFLFDVEANKLRRDFGKHTRKCFHCCRHTYIAHLVSEYRDVYLARLITGHKSDAFETYDHIFEQLSEEVSRKRVFKRRQRKVEIKKVS